MKLKILLTGRKLLLTLEVNHSSVILTVILLLSQSAS